MQEKGEFLLSHCACFGVLRSWLFVWLPLTVRLRRNQALLLGLKPPKANQWRSGRIDRLAG